MLVGFGLESFDKNIPESNGASVPTAIFCLWPYLSPSFSMFSGNAKEMVVIVICH